MPGLIDAHVHLYPATTSREPIAWAAARGEKHWADLCTRRRNNGEAVQGFPSVDELLRAMDAAGVARAVLLGWYWEKPETCTWQNRFYAECIHAHADRLSAFATIHPADGEDALTEIWRAKGEGLLGIGEISPHSQHFALTDPVWEQILILAGELSMPVNLHVTDPQGPRYPGRVETPHQDFLQLANRFPQTSFILAHWGGGLAFEPTDTLPPNLFFDTAASPLLYGPSAWSRALAAGNAPRCLFGSDFPLRLYPREEPGYGWDRFVAEARENWKAEKFLALTEHTPARLLGL